MPISLLAAKAGKAMYTEKPLGICIEQDLKARAIADTFGCTFQYGAQQRSIQHVRMGIELVLNGHIGDVKAVYVWAPAGESGGSARSTTSIPPCGPTSPAIFRTSPSGPAARSHGTR
ncbi:MAG: hypothetical protein BWK77_08540 [Verrucomicrobia bacterium A1]|nr:MAG: hypothetical protein BWK77_08540 [Verrucomicrobia bacterium A1]